MGGYLIIKCRRKIFIPAIIVLAVLVAILLIFALVPIKSFFKFNKIYSSWLDRPYSQVNSFNRIDYGEIDSLNYQLRQFGGEVPKQPELFKKKLLKYLPNTNRWIMGVYGERQTAAIVGMIDCNKYANYIAEDGEGYQPNHIVTDINGNEIDSVLHGQMLFMEITPNCIMDNHLRFRVYLPDMTKYDEVTIDLEFKALE